MATAESIESQFRSTIFFSAISRHCFIVTRDFLNADNRAEAFLAHDLHRVIDVG